LIHFYKREGHSAQGQGQDEDYLGTIQ